MVAINPLVAVAGHQRLNFGNEEKRTKEVAAHCQAMGALKESVGAKVLVEWN